MEHIDPAKAKVLDQNRAGKPCSFCQEKDPQFAQRPALDQLVARGQHCAYAHVTEDDYIRHRIVELAELKVRFQVAAA